MDTTVITAIIGAVGVIIAALIALIPFLLQRNAIGRINNNLPIQSSNQNQIHINSTSNDIEQRLRQDSRIQRLLNNKNWSDTAEAAIAYYCHGLDYPIKDWQKTSTWQQVKAVYVELKK